MTDNKRFSPACERNKEPILAILKQFLQKGEEVLEIASGTGQHAAYWATQLPEVIWQPSDINVEACESIEAYRQAARSANFLAPLCLSTLDKEWDLHVFDAVVCCNMLHISPWQATKGLLSLCHKHLKRDKHLFLYGPFFSQDETPAASNIAFDQSLRAKNHEWGVRNLHDLDALAQTVGLIRQQVFAMPANNLLLIYQLES